MRQPADPGDHEGRVLAASGLGSDLAALHDDTLGVGGREHLVLNLDFTSVELPRILCALKGLVLPIISTSSSAVDFTVWTGEVLERNEGGLAANAFVSFFWFCFADLGLRGRAMD